MKYTKLVPGSLALTVLMSLAVGGSLFGSRSAEAGPPGDLYTVTVCDKSNKAEVRLHRELCDQSAQEPYFGDYKVPGAGGSHGIFRPVDDVPDLRRCEETKNYDPSYAQVYQCCAANPDNPDLEPCN